MIPFPLATNRRLPSGLTRTEVGYQPTGMKPSERLLPAMLTSNTATLLLSAFATKRVFSSGDSARLFGVEREPDPDGARRSTSRAVCRARYRTASSWFWQRWLH